MDIREKLRFIEHIQQPSCRNEKKIEAKLSTEQITDCQLLETEFGKVLIKIKEYDAGINHGIVSLERADEISPYFLQLAGKDKNLLQMDLRRSLFFDTETTGLAGGSGTYIFLAGFGYFENTKFIIKQFFLRDFPDERATLHAIKELMQQFDGIISFNGKSFDLPLLQTRFTYHRIKNNFVELPHLDLLHAARRVWKHRLKDCSLGNLEYEIINVQRDNDIPSFLIPQLYFEYLRTKDLQPLKQVFYHNEIDILSLVSLTIMLNQIHEQPTEKLDNQIDLRTLANHYQNTKQWQRNIAIYQSLIESENNQESKTELFLRLGFCYKALGQWENAVATWEQALSVGKFHIEIYEELAKYYEHHLRDFSRAEQLVQQALTNLEFMEQVQNNNYHPDHRNNLIHRLQRIQRKKGISYKL